MLGKKSNYELLEFEGVRSYLISKTAGFRLIADKFKQHHKLNKLSSIDQKSLLVKASFGIYPNLRADLETISRAVKINTELLEDLISGWIEHKGFNFTSLPLHVATGEPFADGFYIKVDPHTRLQTVEKTYRYIQLLLKDLAKNADSGPKMVISKRDKPISDLNKKIKVVLLIEDYLYEHYYNREKSEQCSKADMMNNERKANPFIEKAFWYAINNLKLPEKEYGHIKDSYYSVNRHYLIPSFQKFKKLLIKPLQ